eukprot:364202-Chlamydomonas_euryale.AAC.1
MTSAADWKLSQCARAGEPKAEPRMARTGAPLASSTCAHPVQAQQRQRKQQLRQDDPNAGARQLMAAGPRARA